MIDLRNALGAWARAKSSASTGARLALLALALQATTALAQDRAADAPEFTLIGTVVDGQTGAVLPGAWVGMTGTEWGSITNDDGRFRIPGMTEGRLALDIELIGYEPLEWTGPVDADGGLVIELAPQAIVLEGLQVVTDRFRSRRRATATTVQAYDPGALASSGAQNALEFIEFNSATWATSCNGRYTSQCLVVRGRTVEPTVWVDEAPVIGGLEYLQSFEPWEFHMIEVYAGGRHIRAYTPHFMERAARNRLFPVPLTF